MSFFCAGFNSIIRQPTEADPLRPANAGRPLPSVQVLPARKTKGSYELPSCAAGSFASDITSLQTQKTLSGLLCSYSVPPVGISLLVPR